jgi:hypothetical protein
MDRPKQVVVVGEPSEVERRLWELGLDVGVLHQALRAGLAERNACTPNDPPGFGGIVAWGRTVRRLRELLIPRGWLRTNLRRLAAVANPDGAVAIAVSTGDEHTGIDDPDVAPHTRYAKGPAWVAAVEDNCGQLDFPPIPGMVAEDPDDILSDEEAERLNRVTWVLMFYVDAGETRCELSLPRNLGPDSKLDTWAERIILPPLPNDPEPVEETVPLTLIDVPVKRRAV